MTAFRIFNVFRDRSAVQSAYGEATPRFLSAPKTEHLTARWSFSSLGRPACRWAA